MVSRTLESPIVQTIITVVSLMTLAVVIVPEVFPSFSLLTNYANIIMLAFLFLGLSFLMLKQPVLTFVCFGATAFLGVYLKYSIQNDDIERWKETVSKERQLPKGFIDDVPFQIAHFNVSNFTNTQSAIDVIKESKADILSIHEITPFWDEWLRDSLSSIYPFSHSMVDIGLYGQAVYSAYQLSNVDTVFYNELPLLIGSVKIDGKPLNFISVHTEPALNNSSRLRLQEHLKLVAEMVRKSTIPVIVFGDFNCVSWLDDFKKFRTNAGLLESRTGFVPFSSIGISSFLDVPLDHILFTPSIQCIGFKNLDCKTELKSMGICGTYLFKNYGGHATKTAQ